ncbi:MAG: pentapeptide repeat-containing protein, partial [Actinomycetota bacterium]
MSENLILAWKAVRPDLKTRNGYQWPGLGRWATVPADRIKTSNKTPCPIQDGDGLCLAKNFQGARLSGIPARTVLVCGYRQEDVLGEDSDKLRVSRAFVVELLDGESVIKQAGRAYLRGADLGGAYLGGAYLGGA